MSSAGVQPSAGDGGSRTGSVRSNPWSALAIALMAGGALVLCGGHGSRAADAAVCASLRGEAKDDCLRLAAIPDETDAASRSGDIGARAASPLDAHAYRTVGADAVSDDPEKVLRQPIAIGEGRCYYFAVGDYRCLVQGRAAAVAVIASTIVPPDAQVSVEQGCRAAEARPASACRHRLLLVASAFRKLASTGGGPLLVLQTETLMIPWRTSPDLSVPNEEIIAR